MKNQLGVITAKIDDLPSTLAKYLSNIGTTPTTLHATASADPYPSISEPKLVVPPPLDPKDYPNVKHWTPKDYNAKRKKVKSEEEGGESLDANAPAPGTSKKSRKRPSGEVSVLSCFMEDENGEQIPESTKSAARGKAKEFWIKLVRRGIAPSRHSEADIDIRDEYLAIMETSFPWLRYCDNHWKAHQIWRNNYSDWYNPKKGKGKGKDKEAAEGEVIDVDADAGDSQDNQEGSSKRPRVDDEASSEAKRRRVEEDKSTPPSRPVPTKITSKRLRVRSILYIT